MAEEECEEGGQTVHPSYLVIGSFGRKEKESQFLGHVPDVLLKNTHREAAASRQLRCRQAPLGNAWRPLG